MKIQCERNLKGIVLHVGQRADLLTKINKQTKISFLHKHTYTKTLQNKKQQSRSLEKNRKEVGEKIVENLLSAKASPHSLAPSHNAAWYGRQVFLLQIKQLTQSDVTQNSQLTKRGSWSSNQGLMLRWLFSSKVLYCSPNPYCDVL